MLGKRPSAAAAVLLTEVLVRSVEVPELQPVAAAQQLASRDRIQSSRWVPLWSMLTAEVTQIFFFE